MAQPGFDDDVVDTPIDGGIAILIGSGLVFGAKKIKNQVLKLNMIYKLFLKATI